MTLGFKSGHFFLLTIRHCRQAKQGIGGFSPPEDAPYAAIVALTARRRHSYLCPKIAVAGYRDDGFLYHLQQRGKPQNTAVNHKFGSPPAKQKQRFIPKEIRKKSSKRFCSAATTLIRRLPPRLSLRLPSPETERK